VLSGRVDGQRARKRRSSLLLDGKDHIALEEL